MSATSPDVRVHFDIHPAHPSAVTAHLTGTLLSPRALLTGRGFEPLDEHTMVLARIDHEEPYWANQALDKPSMLAVTGAERVQPR